MPISTSSLKAIQQAGQALLAAKKAVAVDVQSSSERVVATVVRNPFSPELDQAYGQLRVIARMVHELQAQEEKLIELYAQAGELSGEKLTVMAALPNTEQQIRSRAFADQHAVEDVVEKSPTAAVGKRLKMKAVRAAGKQAKPANQGKILQSVAPTQKAHLTPNDMKVLKFLKTTLNRRIQTKLTHSAVALAAGIPAGSVGIALSHLIDCNKIVESSKGAFRLA